MTKIELSHNTQMVRRLLSMIGSQVNHDDPGLGNDATSELRLIDDILMVAGCWTEVFNEFRQYMVTGTLQSHCDMTPDECVEALKWVLEKTGNPEEVLRILSSDRTLHFLSDGDESDGLFGHGRLVFFKDFCGKRSIRQRLGLAAEAVRLSDKNSHVWLGLLDFTLWLLADIKFDVFAPICSRRNLICAGLECILDDVEHSVQPGLRCVSTRDVAFGIKEMIRLIDYE